MPQPGHKHSESYETGNDGIAEFTICVHPGDQTLPECPYCHRKVVFTIMYRDGDANGITAGLQRRWSLPVEQTLLKSAKNCLCLQCWGKFQRQVTHVAEKGAAKGLTSVA